MTKLKHLFLVSFLFLFSACMADEGMWLPFLLNNNLKEMQALGFKLTPDDLYGINKSSIKDAIVLFGGGCTGEIISDEGLVLTNHHCGLFFIQKHSTLDTNLLENGFWAKNKGEELSNPGLSVTFIVRMEDVTSTILKDYQPGMTEYQRDSLVKVHAVALQKKTAEGTHYEARVSPLYYGMEYIMVVTETFKDIRLVGAPPESIGNFGFDTDNWMWPRHTGDFSLFRIYVGKDNEPAEYSIDNKPYKPKYSLSISLKGIQENDFAMVYGFPGRTTEYISSYGADLIQNVSDPGKIKIRDARLRIMKAAMAINDTVKMQYASKQANVSNAWKKWIGEVKGMKKSEVIESKINLEKQFQTWLTKEKSSNNYNGILAELKTIYEKMTALQRAADYQNEAVFGIELFQFAKNFIDLVRPASEETRTADELKTAAKKLLTGCESFFKDYNIATDKKICATLLEIYYEDVHSTIFPDEFKNLSVKFQQDYTKLSEYLYNNSFMTSLKKIHKLLEDFNDKSKEAIRKDPVFILVSDFINNYNTNINPPLQTANARINVLQRTYLDGLRKMEPNRHFYPDANLTLRLSYGSIKGYKPYDAGIYRYYSTLKGVMEKEDASNPEFKVNPKLKELFQRGDYGRYSQNGELHTCFISNCHTTGGNSGSPVLNADGQLIGTNFDRAWESTMSDLVYDPDRVRNVILDIHYTLFIIDKFGGAGYLLNEMKIQN